MKTNRMSYFKKEIQKQSKCLLISIQFNFYFYKTIVTREVVTILHLKVDLKVKTE